MEKNINKVIDHSIYSLGKDTDGVERNTKELHTILLKMADEIDRVCRLNNIPYALTFGSCLGLYNYQGFIPWDDDMDIAIPYEYISSFVEACNKDLSKELLFECYENNKNYNVLVPTGKVRLKNSYLRESSHSTLPNRCGSGETIFIDIIAFMGVPEDYREHARLIKKARRQVIPYCFLDAFLRIDPYKRKKRIKDFERAIFEKYQNSNRVNQTIIVPWQPIPKSYYRSIPRDVVYPFKEYEFEGRKYFSFNNIEEFCRICYGDRWLRKWDGEKWFDPFPLSKRKIPHIKIFNLYHNKSIKNKKR